MPRLIVVEDDPQLNRTVCTFLERRGYAVAGCLNANEAYNELYDVGADLVISDVMMPGIDGFELARTVRSLDKEIPILLLTARDSMEAKRRGFTIGIDDYLVKPVNLEELDLRIGALLRRAGHEAKKRLEIGDLVLDEEEHAAYLSGEEVPLTVREFDILFLLLSHPKKTFTRAQIMRDCWDVDSLAGLRTVDVYITKLRSKFARCGAFEIVTVHGLGYKAVRHE